MERKNGEDYPEWKSLPFRNVFTMLGNNTLSRADLNDESGSVRNVHYGDILTKYGAFIDVKTEKIPFISNEDNAMKAMKYALINGDIVIADTAEDETVGKLTEIINAEGVDLVAGLHTIPCRPVKGMFAKKYLGYYMNAHAYHSQLYPLIQGTKVSSISKSAIQDTIISVPCLEEQDKIAKSLAAIDKVISLKKRKLETWKTIKKGLLQQMFV